MQERVSSLTPCATFGALAQTSLTGPLGSWDLELQEPLTLAVSSCVARGTMAVAGADVEMSVVPAAHATWVPGDLWSDEDEF